MSTGGRGFAPASAALQLQLWPVPSKHLAMKLKHIMTRLNEAAIDEAWSSVSNTFVLSCRERCDEWGCREVVAVVALLAAGGGRRWCRWWR